MATAETTTIGEYTYAVVSPLGRAGAHMALRISQWAFPFYFEILRSKGDASILMRAFGEMLSKLNGDEIEYLNTELGKLTQVSWAGPRGEPMSRTLDQAFFDSHFQDRQDAWVEWLVFALKRTQRSFFAGALKSGALFQSATQASPTPENSSSQSPSSVERTG